ncbi:MAG: hypothetical protein PHV78_00875 [Patescibacteria group bacterium]|nr:hypothetical protein [Patescibacteria group bacterium]MDD5121280.1 hypothetical protein [Patescibacteria group bacterium]MDD5221828.1 hypothetical protein [Patescibacteria group bacterium]MDD5395801.1 hypothetical protein [Patescibacteria group bacterium]
MKLHPSIIRIWKRTCRWLKEIWPFLSPWGRAVVRFTEEAPSGKEIPLWNMLFTLVRTYLEAKTPIGFPEDQEELMRLPTVLYYLRMLMLRIPELEKVRKGLLWNPFYESKHLQLARQVERIIYVLQRYDDYAAVCEIEVPKELPQLHSTKVLSRTIVQLRSLEKGADNDRAKANNLCHDFMRHQLYELIAAVNAINQLLHPES